MSSVTAPAWDVRHCQSGAAAVLLGREALLYSLKSRSLPVCLSTGPYAGELILPRKTKLCYAAVQLKHSHRGVLHEGKNERKMRAL